MHYLLNHQDTEIVSFHSNGIGLCCFAIKEHNINTVHCYQRTWLQNLRSKPFGYLRLLTIIFFKVIALLNYWNWNMLLLFLSNSHLSSKFCICVDRSTPSKAAFFIEQRSVLADRGSLKPVYTIQPVVKPVVIPVWQPVECLYARYNRLSNQLYNRFDNRLYRVNGV